MLKDKIIEKLNAFIADRDLFFVDVKITPQQKIMLFVDGKKNITINQCVEISRMLEAYLEEENLVNDKYVLEVSSPGMTEPLKVKEQYIKATGRKVEVLKKDGIKYKGLLKQFENDILTLEVEKKKKKKVIETNLVEIPLAEIKTTKKLITFK